MGLTRNGQRIGMAAHMERVDFARFLNEDADRRREQNEAAWYELLEAVTVLDPQGWSDWYDTNVPEWSDWLNAPLDVLSERVDYLLFGGVDVDRFHELIKGL